MTAMDMDGITIILDRARGTNDEHSLACWAEIEDALKPFKERGARVRWAVQRQTAERGQP
jgi:hypothetical protein